MTTHQVMCYEEKKGGRKQAQGIACERDANTAYTCKLIPSDEQKNRMTDLLTYSVGPRNNRPALKGSPSISVNILRPKMTVSNVISPLFKGDPEIKVKNLQSQWDR